MSPPVPNLVEVVDPDGDVLLTVPSPKEGAQSPAPSKFLCSSKYLIPASTLFKARLGPNGRDAQKLAEHGSIKITLHATAHDSDTMHIVLSIIHGLHPRIPSEFDAIGLWKVALATRYFQCYATLRSWGLWYCDQLLPVLPTDFGPSSWKWILISYVFGHEKLFRQLTMMAQQRATGSIYAGPSPIPRWILRKILGKRDEFLETCFRLIHERLSSLASPYNICTPECDGKKAAALIQYTSQFQLRVRLVVDENETAPLPLECSPFLFCEAAKRWQNPEHANWGHPSHLRVSSSFSKSPLSQIELAEAYASVTVLDESSDADDPPPRDTVHPPGDTDWFKGFAMDDTPCAHQHGLLGEALAQHLERMEQQLQGVSGVLDRYPGRQ